MANATSDGILPAGITTGYAGATAPAGWLLCDGSAVSRTTYAALFAAIGTAYGSGDGSTTFNVPDFRGRVSVGYDASQSEFNAIGKTSGAKTVALQTSELPAHSHGVNDPGHSHGVTDPGHTHVERIVNSGTAGTVGVQGASSASNADASNSPTKSGTTGLTVNSGTTGVTTQNAGGGGAHNNLQPYLCENRIIKT